jgi:hypothetical protein
MNHYLLFINKKESNIVDVNSKIDEFLNEIKTKINDFIQTKEENKESFNNLKLKEIVDHCQNLQVCDNLSRFKLENLNDLLNKIILSNSNKINDSNSSFKISSTSFNKFYINYTREQNNKTIEIDDLPIKNIVSKIVRMILANKLQQYFDMCFKHFNEKLELISDFKNDIDENEISKSKSKIKDKILEEISYNESA